jgi:DtxR family Mn-dependent transcriptional regulator
MDPGISLLVSALTVAAAVILFWPVRGLWWRGLRGFRATERVRIEDALKHLYDCDYRRQPATLQSLAGAIGISGNGAGRLLERLQQLGLSTATGGRLELTAEGRGYALRVIRVHRLWERYFSEHTGLAAAEWHAQAEHREHRTSSSEANALAARMGFPLYDPHGDPIPTATGEIVPPAGQSLSDLPVGQPAAIIHVEDEPQAIYAQLAAEGLHPGVRVRVLESGPARIRFEAEGEERVLAPIVAANVTVTPCEADLPEAGGTTPLSTLVPGQQARVVRLSPAFRGAERRRMLDLGIVPGTVVQAEMKSPSGDPTAYRVRGALIALRREQADLIYVERPVEGAAA